jgi:acylglycerol lipase
MVDQQGMWCFVDIANARINSYLPSLLLLPAAIHAVLTDVVRVDLAAGRDQRKVFLSGA